MDDGCKDLAEAGGEERALDVIESLDISDSWRKTYRAIEAMEPIRSGLMPAYANPGATEAKGVSIHFNGAAYFLGPFYYMAIGLPKKAATMIGFAVLLFLGLEVVAAPAIVHRLVGFALQAVYAVNANLDRYRKQVQGEDFWI